MSFLTSLTRAWLTRSLRPFALQMNMISIWTMPIPRPGHLYPHPLLPEFVRFLPLLQGGILRGNGKSLCGGLKKEIALVGERGGRRKKITTLYFGGGTPALVAGDLKGIIGTVEKYFSVTEGIGVELHPADVTEEKLGLLKKAGVTRISIGIQSFGEEYLELLGRGEHDYGKMFAALRAVPFETVAMDFIFGLPGQTIESIKSDIETAFANGANHIALYPFIDFTYTRRSFEKMLEAQKKKLMAKLRNTVAGGGM
jgi:oxygen-independent coproporphyrinogen-3 oxidase